MDSASEDGKRWAGVSKWLMHGIDRSHAKVRFYVTGTKEEERMREVREHDSLLYGKCSSVLVHVRPCSLVFARVWLIN